VIIGERAAEIAKVQAMKSPTRTAEPKARIMTLDLPERLFQVLRHRERWPGQGANALLKLIRRPG
jgi:hypothetical protein